MTTSAASSALPEVVRPRPHHPVLRRAADALQFGLLAGGAVEAARLTPPLRGLLRELHGGRRLDELLARAGELGADPADAHALLADLYAAGALVDAGAHARVTEARRSACVLVSGGGPLLPEVAGGLAGAGVGRIRVAEEGTGPAAGEGRTYAAAAGKTVRRIAPGARFGVGPPRARPDLVVLAGPLRPDQELHAALARRGVPQLVVRVTDGIGLVGPLVLAGRSGCLRCGDLHRAERDPCWATVAADLGGRIGSASHTTAAATAALAAEQAVLVLDSLVVAGRPPPTLGAVLEFDARGGEVRRRRWPPHPRCACGAARAWANEPEETASTGEEWPGRALPDPVAARAPCEEVVRR